VAFNLDDYTTVQERSNIFWERYKDGAIRTELVEASDTRFIVVCKLFRKADDAQPFAIGHAQEVISDRGVNRDFALENCETSARGVAFKAANIGTEKNAPSREEMEKVKRLENKPVYSAPNTRSRAVENALRSSFNDEVKAAIDPKPIAWSVGETIAQIGEVVDVSFTCSHGDMVKKEGISKSNNKPYAGYVCSAPKGEQCAPKWAKLTAAGTWYWPDDSEPGKGGE